jgi:hypothetical protein
MSTEDHNETLAGIHLAIGAFFTFGLAVSPWVVGHRRQLESIALVSVALLPLALLMFCTAIAMHRKKPVGRKLAMWSVAVLFMIFWPAAVYSWWFLQSKGGKEMYDQT